VRKNSKDMSMNIGKSRIKNDITIEEGQEKSRNSITRLKNSSNAAKKHKNLT
jgi:hypothetical protein